MTPIAHDDAFFTLGTTAGLPGSALLMRSCTVEQVGSETPKIKTRSGSFVSKSALFVVFLSLVAAGQSAFAESEPKITDDDREHWSFAPLVRPDVPAHVGDWPRNSIDSFVLKKLVDAGLSPAPEASRTVLLRRLCFDLTGLPPTLEQIDDFLKDETSEAYDRLVDQLLESPAYGERSAQHWLDLARFAETDGFEHDKLRPDAWKYRDWVIDAFNDDMPYDEFVRLQLAGDEAGSANRVATSFLTCGPDMPDINLQEERRHSFMNEMTSTVGSVFLGLQVGCAQCHDHKYDPISQLDFYRLRAFFDPAFQFTKNKVASLPDGNDAKSVSYLMVRGDFRRVGDTVEAAFPRIVNAAGAAPDVASDRRNLRTQLARWLTNPDNPLSMRTIANRLWQHHFGEGLCDSPSDFGVMGDVPEHDKLLDWLATEFPRRSFSFKNMHRLIVTSATYRQASRLPDDASPAVAEKWQQSLKADRKNRLWSRMSRRRLEGEAVRDAMLLAAGQLSERRGGPGIRPPLPDELLHTLLKNQWPVSKDPEDYTRRSIYLFVRRNLRYPLFEAFDKPDTNFSCPRRNESTIAPQALMLLNSKLSLDAAKALAALVEEAAGESSVEANSRIKLACLRTLSRNPSSDELKLAAQFLRSSPDGQTAALTDLCLALFNLNEFLYVD
ncbi:MAG: DUF1553 domain-containing protein [Planctomycetaceae bacterium]|nr:DUF1553 domain-containing protein [Planctomycetaceae bacterium]